MASGMIKTHIRSITLTNKSTESDGALLIQEIPSTATLISSRLLGPSNHLLIPSTKSISGQGYTLLLLLDVNDKQFISNRITISGVINYSDN